MNCGFCKVARGDRIFCKEKHSPKASHCVLQKSIIFLLKIFCTLQCIELSGCIINKAINHKSFLIASGEFAFSDASCRFRVKLASGGRS